MANKVLQVLALAGVACLLAGQGQAAGTNEERQACLAAASKKLADVVVPDEVKPLASITLRIFPNNLYEKIREKVPEGYMALMMGKYVDSCENLLEISANIILNACPQFMDDSLEADLWALGKEVQYVMIAGLSCELASRFYVLRPELNGEECLSVVSRAMVDMKSAIPDDVKELVEEARKIRQRLLGNTEMVAGNEKRYEEAMRKKFVEGCTDLERQLEEMVAREERCDEFFSQFRKEDTSFEVVKIHNPAAEEVAEAMHVCQMSK
jgi:hypothetical protein